MLAEREVPMVWLERALNHPERIETDARDPGLAHHLTRIPEHGRRVLRVVVRKTVRPALVITVYFDRAMKDMA